MGSSGVAHVQSQGWVKIAGRKEKVSPACADNGSCFCARQYCLRAAIPKDVETRKQHFWSFYIVISGSHVPLAPSDHALFLAHLLNKIRV